MVAMRDVEFLFDYASPYAYLANERAQTMLPGVRINHVRVYLRGFEAFVRR